MWSRLIRWVATSAITLLCLVVCGCPPRRPIEPPAPIPMHRAIGIVNANSANIRETLRAKGSVSGHFTTPEGKRKSYDLDGYLFYLPPRSLRFDLKSIAGSEMLIGSNYTHYWFNNKRDGDYYYCRPHNDAGRGPGASPLPVRPDQMIEALGLNMIGLGKPGVRVEPPVHRVVENHQQLLFFLRDDAGRLLLEKEYWLDRWEPRLIRRIVFRNPAGIVEMESRLDDYRQISPKGPYLPRDVEVHWPTEDASLRFKISRWRVEPQVRPGSPQFIPPHALGLRFGREDIVE